MVDSGRGQGWLLGGAVKWVVCCGECFISGSWVVLVGGFQVVTNKEKGGGC